MPTTVRIAAWSARHRWPVFVLWFVGTIGLFLASTVAGGTRTTSTGSPQGAAERFESNVAYDIFGAASDPNQPAGPASQSFLVIFESESTTVDDPAFQSAIHETSLGLSAVLVDVIDPLTVPDAARPQFVSADGQAARITASLQGSGDEAEGRLGQAVAIVDGVKATHPDLTILPLNQRLANHEIIGLVNDDLDASLKLTIPITFVILLIAFGAAVAAVVPLVLAISALLAAFGVLGLYSQSVAPVAEFASQLVVLIGLAVSVDYSLFMISRFRAERRRGHDKPRAIEIASATAGRAVLFSGLAVMFSIAGLFILDDPTLRGMAVGTIAVVLIAVVGSLTLLPATIAILGDRLDRGRIPFFGRDREEGHGAWSTFVRGVARRPLVAAAASVALLIALALPALRLQLGESTLAAFPSSLGVVKAVNILDREWPGGTTLQLQVVVTHADDAAYAGAARVLDTALLTIPGVSGPPETRLSGDGTVAMHSYTLSGTQNDEDNRRIVREVRQHIAPDVFAVVPGAETYVTGEVAQILDQVDYFLGSMPPVFAFVLGLTFVLLLIVFRSLVIPVKAILLNLLSTGAAYGVLVLVFQDGWFADILDIKPGIVDEFVPVFIFTILFGLSMDYHVFILTRIKEAKDHGLSSNEAVVRGIAITSGTITSAAAIMVAVFAVFVSLRLVIIKEIGLGLAVAIFLDATVVRTVLLPATMRLLGDWNWWLPKWLGWLPHVTLEGDTGEELATS